MQEKANMDKKRKRTIFILCTSIIIIALLVLSIINYFERDLFEVIINLVIISVLFAGMITIEKWDKDVIIYRGTHLLICLIFFYSVMIGVGRETVLYWVFMMPLLFFYFFGKSEGLIWTVVFSFCICLIMLASALIGVHSYSQITISRFIIVLLILIIIGYGLEASRDSYSRLLNEKNEVLLREKELLERALREIKTLSGLIPICCHCKKIRDDQGYWQQVEKYVQDRTEADFSHSICPECVEKLYPEYKGFMEQQQSPDKNAVITDT